MPDIEAMLASLQALHPRVIDLSLERVATLLEKLGRPQDRLPPVVHVAGTNGKGSTVAFLRAILEAAGHSVHAYTSPHLVRFNERIRIGAPGGGRFVDDAALAEAIGHIQTVNDGAEVTYFEATTAIALHLFAEHPADFCLLEVGLGGRFDATNVIDAPLAAAISPVSHDHAEFLGEDLAGIAAEKAGILKPGRPAVIGPQDEHAMAMIALEADAVGAPLFKFGEDWMVNGERGRLVYEDGDGLLDLPMPKLFGDHQIANAGLAVATLRATKTSVPKSALDAGIVATRWPARMQRLASGPLVERLPDDSEVWLDGGHNPAAGYALSSAMGQLEERVPRPLVLITGMLSTKDPAGFFLPFDGLARYVLAVPVPDSGAGIEPGVLADIAMACDLPARAMESVGEALDAIKSMFEGDEAPRVLICGSLYLAGDILKQNGPLPD
jgi:dihydrofolate synthase/folylpolyglutamate synthase